MGKQVRLKQRSKVVTSLTPDTVEGLPLRFDSRRGGNVDYILREAVDLVDYSVVWVNVRTEYSVYK